MHLIHWCVNQLEEYQKYHPKACKKKNRPMTKWQNPPNGRLKINIDGAFRVDSGNGGISVVVRNDAGMNIAAMARPFVHAHSALNMEAEACRAGLFLGIHQGWTEIDIEIDSTLLIAALQSEEKNFSEVGSFLMGWCGVVFKADISYRSDFLAIGLTTGYLGSVTTFSGWNQKMLELSVEGHWVFAGLGFLIGLFLAAYSIIFGVETSKCFRQLLVRNSGYGVASSRKSWRVDSHKRHLAVLAVFLLLLAGLWTMSGILMRQEFNSNSSETQLWLACIVGPLGVWVRWFLARLNGRGLGKTGLLKWVPFGTLIANVSAACIMAALATVKREVNTKTCDIVATGIQFGFLGCLSTVSTFIAEFNAMRESKYPWRAYIYATVTICTSFCLGTLIYSVPVWAKGDN